MTFDMLKTYEVFQKMEKIKQDAIVEAINKTQNLSMEKALSLILQINAKLKAAGHSFTKEESSFIINILSEKMTPSEKQKLEKLKKLFNF